VALDADTDTVLAEILDRLRGLGYGARQTSASARDWQPGRNGRGTPSAL
jgi:hypothetical protein